MSTAIQASAPSAPTIALRPVLKGSRLLSLARRNLIASTGASVVIALVLIALLAGILSPFDPNSQVGERLRPPGAPYWLGLDQLGRDVLSRILFGARVSLEVSVTSVAIALLVGASLGVACGYYGGLIDTVAMRLMDVLFTVPTFVLAIALAGVLGPTLFNVVLAIAIVTIPTIARTARAPSLVTRETDFVLSARAAGARDLRILVRHVFPNVLGPIIVQTTVCIADAILIEAALGFLGLGVPPPAATWGNMLGTGRNFMELANGLTIFPGVAIMLTVLGFNFAGDGLRDILDPRLRGET